MSITHEVTTIAVGHDFPIAILLDLLTNVAHSSAEITNSVLGECLASADTPATGEMIDDLTLPGEGDAVRHNNIPVLTCTPI